MPLYFYHLAFELYPSARPTLPDSNTWLPEKRSDIFDSASWPSHSPACAFVYPTSAEQTKLQGKPVANGSREQPDIERRQSGEIVDCGLSRPSLSWEQKSEQPTREGEATQKQQIQKQRREEETPQGFSPEKATRDWRFGALRVASVNMPSATDLTMERPQGEGRQSGTNDRGENADGIGIAIHTTLQGPDGNGGRVTKARYEPSQNGAGPGMEVKETDVGWGIVHLYRDGEESVLGGATEIYNSSGTVANGRKEENRHEESKEGDKWTTLCIPAVPSYLTPSDFLGFVGEKTREEVSHFRMVMTGKMNRYLVLMKFRDGNFARKWRAEWDGKVFNSMEVRFSPRLVSTELIPEQPETCHVVFIKSITFQTPLSSPPNTSFPELSHDPFSPSHTSTPTTTTLKPFPPPTSSLVELPTCPVCLERMDDTTGLLTIPCQHVFHCSCLQKWRGSGCPVCRHTNPSLSLPSHISLSSNNLPPPNPITYSDDATDPTYPPFGSNPTNLCTICDTSSDLWICLICGNVGCGRYKGGHAKEHWKGSGHNFALEIETQHVWDYADDVWVHRLIRGKGDGKVVELPSRRSGLRGGNGLGGDNRDEGRDMVPREKLDALGMEYTHLLTSQLESQRVYFEELVCKAVSKASAASSVAAAATAKADEAITALSSLKVSHKRLEEGIIPGLERGLDREKRKAEKASELARNLNKSLGEERKVGEGLLERVGFVNKEVERLKAEMDQLRMENEGLKEENRDLAFAVCGAEKVREMEEQAGEGDDNGEQRSGMGLEKGEVEGGTMVLPERKEEKRRGKGKGKGKA